MAQRQAYAESEICLQVEPVLLIQTVAPKKLLKLVVGNSVPLSRRVLKAALKILEISLVLIVDWKNLLRGFCYINIFCTHRHRFVYLLRRCILFVSYMSRTVSDSENMLTIVK